MKQLKNRSNTRVNMLNALFSLWYCLSGKKCRISFLILTASFLVTLFSVFESKAQTQQRLSVAQLVIEGTDTIYMYQLEEVVVYGRRKNYFNVKQYETLYRKVKKVYPFALQASKELAIYNQKFMNIEDSKAKKEYLKKVEKEMFANYGDKMKRLSILEGRYLMLLIDRETGNSSFEIIKDLKGSVPAAFWQGLARLFGNNMKDRYDPINAHYLIEQIVLNIQREGITSIETVKSK